MTFDFAARVPILPPFFKYFLYPLFSSLKEKKKKKPPPYATKVRYFFYSSNFGFLRIEDGISFLVFRYLYLEDVPKKKDYFLRYLPKQNNPNKKKKTKKSGRGEGGKDKNHFVKNPFC